jgi:hypothetical protein
VEPICRISLRDKKGKKKACLNVRREKTGETGTAQVWRGMHETYSGPLCDLVEVVDEELTGHNSFSLLAAFVQPGSR